MVKGKPLRRWLIACTQIVVSISLIVWIFLNIDFQNMLQLVATMNILSLIFCIISAGSSCHPSGNSMALVRWQIYA